LQDVDFEPYPEIDSGTRECAAAGNEIPDQAPAELWSEPDALEVHDEVAADAGKHSDRTLARTVVEGPVGSEASAVTPVPDADSVRGRSLDRDDLSTLVTSRLIDIDRANRVSPTVVWSMVGIAALTLAVVALGIWSWLW